MLMLKTIVATAVLAVGGTAAAFAGLHAGQAPAGAATATPAAQARTAQTVHLSAKDLAKLAALIGGKQAKTTARNADRTQEKAQHRSTGRKHTAAHTGQSTTHRTSSGGSSHTSDHQTDHQTGHVSGHTGGEGHSGSHDGGGHD
jgi:hypothetical protein